MTVNSAGWDTHQNIIQLKQRYETDKNAHLPSLDRALGALIGDLSDRGMLDETLVVCMGEMGRTPKFQNRGKSDGRDHWTHCFPVLLAGAGVRGGLRTGSGEPWAGHIQRGLTGKSQ